MSALTERLIAARDQIKPLTSRGEDAVWRPAQRAHDCMADAANAITDMASVLATTSRNLGSLIAAKHHDAVLMTEWKAVVDAAIAKAGAA